MDIAQLTCECGCGQIPNKGKRFVWGHNAKFYLFSEEMKKKRKDRILSPETKEKHRNGLRKAYKEGRLTGLIMDGSNNRGKKYSKAYCQRLSESHLGQHSSPATEFKKGLVPHNKGKPDFLSPEVRERLRIESKGKHYSPRTEFKKGSKVNLGRKHSLETRIKMSQKKIGNDTWIGFVTSTKRLIYGSVKYSQWRQNVFLKDDFTCQMCGNKGNYLHAHHKKKFAILLKEVKQNLPLFDLYNGAMIYSPLWDISNGITLCRNCHKLAHKRK